MLVSWSPYVQSYFNLFNFPTLLRCIHIHRRLHLLALAFPWICGLFTRASLLIFPVLATLPAVIGVNTSHRSHLTWTVALAPLLWRASVSLSVSLADSGFLQWPACLRPASFGPLLRSSVCSCWCHRSPCTSAHVTSHSWTHQADLECPCLFDIFTVFYSCLLVFPRVCHMYSEIWQWKCKRKYVIHTICKRPEYTVCCI